MCEDGHGQAGVGVGGEADAGLVVEQVGNGDGERLIGAVEDIFRLGVLLGAGFGHGFFVGGLQQAQLVLGEDQGIALTAGGLEAEEGLHILEHILKGGLVLPVFGHIVAVKLGVGDFLVGEVGEIGVVVGAGIADGQASGLVVAGDDDEGLIGMAFGELDGNVHRFGEGDGVGDGGAGVVGVAGPVDFAALHHHEETGVIVQNLDALGHIVAEGPGPLGPVILIGEGVGVGEMLVDDENLAVRGGDLLGPGLGLNDLVARLGGQVVETGLVAVGAGGLEQAAAGKVLEAGLHQFLANLVVAAAAGLVGVERCGGGVVQVDGGDDADFEILLCLELLGDGLIGHGGGLIHVDGAGIGLVAGGDGGGGGGRVGAEGGGVVGHGAAGHGEVHEGEGDVSAENAVVVVSHCAQIVGGGLELGIAHAVADEEEDVLGTSGGLRRGGGEGLDRRGGCGKTGVRGLGLSRGGAAAAGQRSGQRHGGQGEGKGALELHIKFPPFIFA